MRSNFIHAFLPYCLKRIEDGRYVILNRQYSPVGTVLSDAIKYGDFAISWPGMSSALAGRLSWRGISCTEQIWLYGDETDPTRSQENLEAYVSRLWMLRAFKIGTSDRPQVDPALTVNYLQEGGERS